MEEAIIKPELQNIIAMSLYMAMVIGIGVYFFKRSNSSSKEYFLGGRSIGPYVTAMSAEASDMSGWLLMGLPGVAYWTGLSSAFWTAFGLAVGTYINWKIVAKPLRVYSHVANDSITIPDFFSNRFKEKGKRKPILFFSAVFILVFFVVYAASCYVTVGKLFSALFGMSYVSMMILGAIFVLAYTFIGGFLAESVSDFMQALVMVFSLVVVLIIGINYAGGVKEIVNNLKQFPGFLEFFTSAKPSLNEMGQQIQTSGIPQFAEATKVSWLEISTSLAWGLGYFGVPQVLIKFMAIRDAREIKIARRVASVWVVISLAAAVFIGLNGRVLFPTEFLTQSASENIFIISAQNMMQPFIAGIVMAGILAATISSADSYLLIGASSVAKNLYQGIFKQNASDKAVLKVTRITLLLITTIGILIALDENSVIFKIVSFAWAGFGATFGPLVLFSLFSGKITRKGGVAGMVVGAMTVFIWDLFLVKFGGVFELFSLLPGFLLSSIAIVVVSSITSVEKEVSEQHEEFKLELEKVKKSI